MHFPIRHWWAQCYRTKADRRSLVTLSRTCLKSGRVTSSAMSREIRLDIAVEGWEAVRSISFAPWSDHQHSISAGFSKSKGRGKSCPLPTTLSLKSVQISLESHASHATHASHSTHSSSRHVLLLLWYLGDNGFSSRQQRCNTCSI